MASLIAPGAFLPAAERYGLIRELDRMVLCKVADILGGVQAGSGVSIAVNLPCRSPTPTCWHSLRAPSNARARTLPADGRGHRDRCDLDMASAREFCSGVSSLGCSVALDDFGAGFGSFQYLKHLPFSHLKIDGDFIRGLPGSPTDQLVVPALAGVVRGMGRETIAEFVGDHRTMSMLREYGVDYAQGFHVGRPVPAIPAIA